MTAKVDDRVIELNLKGAGVHHQTKGCEHDMDCVVREACQSVLSTIERYIDNLLLLAQASAVTGMALHRLLASLTV